MRACVLYVYGRNEIPRYIGPDVDMPSMGYMVGPQEVGYLYGQYKRIYQHSAAKHTGLLWGGLPPWPNAAVRLSRQMGREEDAGY